MSNSDLIKGFYAAFNNLDADAMNRAYCTDATFEDPAFGKLNTSELKAMWSMLCRSQGKNEFKVEVSHIQCDEFKGSARWDAYYTFSKTGRKVHNIIYAQFEFEEGKIKKHQDYFDLYRWSRQAMGPIAWLIGWTPFFKRKLNSQTKNMLKSFSQ